MGLESILVNSNCYVIQNLASPFKTSNSLDPVYLMGFEFTALHSGQITFGVRF